MTGGIGDKMNSNKNEYNEPVCRFGPGGNFISDWPGEVLDSPPGSGNGLTKLLGSIAEVITTVLGSEYEASTVMSGDIDRFKDQIQCREEKFDYAVKTINAEKPADPAPTTVIKSNRRVHEQSMLFADDWRVGVRVEHKPKHRIRAYRRAAKKSLPLQPTRQGSLFETDFKSAKTA